MNIWIVIPAYNEEKALEALLRGLKEKPFSILVVDDGSTDSTYQSAKKYTDIVIHRRRNFGKGIALKQGIAHLMEHEDFEYIITMDADGQHCVHDLEKFLEKARRGAAFVVGNRMHEPRGMPLVRIYTNVLMSWLISKIVHQKIPDTQCGFRLIKREVLENVSIKTKKFEIESEILIKAARRGYAIESIPVQSIYSKSQRSKINPFIDTLRFIKFIFRLENDKS